MTEEQAYTNYAGHWVWIEGVYASLRSRQKSNVTTIDDPRHGPRVRCEVVPARVVGFSKNHGVLVTFVDANTGHNGLYDATSFDRTIAENAARERKLWWIHPNGIVRQLKTSENYALTLNNVDSLVKQAKSDWPHTCKDCGGPALHMATIIDCKNRCRSRNRF